MTRLLIAAALLLCSVTAQAAYTVPVPRPMIYSKTWTNAEVVALGANLNGTITAFTLPPKTQVHSAYVIINSQCASTTSLTVSLGRTSATYIDFIVASNAQVAANTVYGDASAERGTNFDGFVMPSPAASTVVYLRFVSTVENLSAVTACTGVTYVVATTLP